MNSSSKGDARSFDRRCGRVIKGATASARVIGEARSLLSDPAWQMDPHGRGRVRLEADAWASFSRGHYASSSEKKEQNAFLDEGRQVSNQVYKSPPARVAKKRRYSPISLAFTELCGTILKEAARRRQRFYYYSGSLLAEMGADAWGLSRPAKSGGRPRKFATSLR